MENKMNQQRRQNEKPKENEEVGLKCRYTSQKLHGMIV
jgi:hypothetical protein